MAKFYIPEKEKPPLNGYSVKYGRDLIEQFCDDPEHYKSEMYIGAINDAITIYKYSKNISRAWIENVINTLSRYI